MIQHNTTDNRPSAEFVTCEHCKQRYISVPSYAEYLSDVRNIEEIESQITEDELKAGMSFIQVPAKHCTPCGICKTYVPRDTMHKPMGDPWICDPCYESFKASGSDYIFEEDI
jgi:hypothetical protein